MENQEKLMQFVTWLGENVPELKGKAPEQIVETVNKLSASEEGQQMLQGLIKEFESSMTGMFKKGGKLDYLLCLKKGGSIQDCGCGKKIDKKQPGGSIASRLWNKWTGKDTYTDGYGTTRSHVPVKESAHRTILQAADSPLVQAIPVVGDLADGYVAADYAAKGDYKPAMAAIGAGLVLPNVAEMGARFIPKQTWESALKKINDIDLEKTFKYEMSDETKKLFDDIKSGKKKLTKDMNDLTDNEKEQLLEVLTSSSLNRKGVGKGRIPSDTYHNFGPNDLDIDKVWLPEDPNVIGRADVGNVAASQSVEPWWGWDPVEYQQGGRVLGSEQYPHASRKDAIDAAKQLGFEGSDARRAYGDSKKIARQLGFRGNNLRQVARYNLINMAYPRAGMTEEESMNNLLNNFTTKISYN